MTVMNISRNYISITSVSKKKYAKSSATRKDRKEINASVTLLVVNKHTIDDFLVVSFCFCIVINKKNQNIQPIYRRLLIKRNV